jgi:hypothetical protein
MFKIPMNTPQMLSSIGVFFIRSRVRLAKNTSNANYFNVSPDFAGKIKDAAIETAIVPRIKPSE